MEGLHGRVEVFNLVGQKVVEFNIKNGQEQANFTFNPENYMPDNPATGFYLLKLILFDYADRTIYTDSEKLIYLKY